MLNFIFGKRTTNNALDYKCLLGEEINSSEYDVGLSQMMKIFDKRINKFYFIG